VNCTAWCTRPACSKHGGRFAGLEETTAADCVRRLRPKVDGTLVLAEHLRGRKVDFVLMQSSLSAQLGGLGFYAYTAGNAYMDAFRRTAPQRRRALDERQLGRLDLS